jgi:antirestriction protein
VTYAYNLTSDTLSGGTTEIPEYLKNYIDYDAMGRDLGLSGEVFTLQTGYNEVNVFGSQ